MLSNITFLYLQVLICHCHC